MNDLKDINIEKLTEWENRPHARTIKRKLAKEGYTYQLSLYGVATNNKTKTSEYRRIELMNYQPYSQEDLFEIFTMFEDFIPPVKYSILTYNPKTKEFKVKYRGD